MADPTQKLISDAPAGGPSKRPGHLYDVLFADGHTLNPFGGYLPIRV